MHVNILLSAYSFGAWRGSEAGVGWNVAKGLAERGHKVTVLTTPEFHDLNMPALEEVDGALCLREYGFDLGNWATSATYYRWQKLMTSVVLELLHDSDFDIFYQANWNQYRGIRAPFELPVPSIVGPVGGAETIPVSLLGSSSGMPSAQRLKELLRYVGVDALSLRFRRKRACPVFIASNPVTARRLKLWGGIRNVLVSPAIAVKSDEIRPRNTDARRRLYYDGGSRPEKGMTLFLQALARMPRRAEGIRAVVPGVKEETHSYIRELACSMGVKAELQLLPFIPRKQVLDFMRESTLFLSTAYRDSGGMGILEACSQGCRVICLDIPSQWWLSDDLAHKVKVGTSFLETANRLASVISSEWKSPNFAEDELRMDYLISHMSWEAKVNELEKVMRKSCLVS